MNIRLTLIMPIRRFSPLIFVYTLALGQVPLPSEVDGKLAELRQRYELEVGRTLEAEERGGMGNLKRMYEQSLERSISAAANRNDAAAAKAFDDELGSSDITDGDLEKLTVLKGLKRLTIPQTMVTADGIKRFSKRRPNCELVAE